MSYIYIKKMKPSSVYGCMRWFCHKVLVLILLVIAETSTSTKYGISTGALVGAVLGGIAAAVTLSAIVSLIILRKRSKYYHTISRKRHSECLIIIIDCLHKYIIILTLLFPLLLVLTSVDVLVFFLVNSWCSCLFQHTSVIFESYVWLFVFIVIWKWNQHLLL